MSNKYLDGVMKNEYVLFLHNGYSEFSYGVSVNPIELSFTEYQLLKSFISNFGFNDFIEDFEKSQKYDCKIPKPISDIIGYTIITISPASCCEYTSEEEKNAIRGAKEKLIDIIKA